MIRPTVLALCTGTALAWAQLPDLNQLKSEFEQLDQMMQDLKQQIAAAEAAQQTPRQPLLAKTSQPQPAKAPVPQCRSIT